MESNYIKRTHIRKSQAFRSTNNPWNELNLNAGWSIGLIVKIVGAESFYSFEEWENYYFESAQKRQSLLKNAVPASRQRLMDLRSVFTSSNQFKQGLTRYEVDINEAHGRTLEELAFIAKCLHEEVVKRGNPFELTEEDCMNHVYIRVVDEAYIGIQREVNTIHTLSNHYPDLTFVFTEADKDRHYAIDAEVFDVSGKLLCGLQIKSAFFNRGKTRAMKSAQTFNLKKHEQYNKRFGVPAYFVHSTVEGDIQNNETFQHLDRFIQPKSLQTT